MSSGGSGSSTNVPPRENGEKTKCDMLSFLTYLSSPVPSIIKRLKVGSVLEIELDPNTGVIGAYLNNKIAGSITSSRLAELLKCMNNGYVYIATVQSISGGSCQILISTP